jgi:predicted alpha/beta hydrolase family esterase
MSQARKDLRLLIAPAFGATEKDHFYPWLKKSLLAAPNNPFEQIDVVAAPESEMTDRLGYGQAIWKALGDDYSRTVFLGHGLGALACIYALTRCPQESSPGYMSVGGFFTTHNSDRVLDDWEVAIGTGKMYLWRQRVALLADPDPDMKNRAHELSQWEDTNTRIIEVAGASKFTRREEPSVLDAILDEWGYAPEDEDDE